MTRTIKVVVGTNVVISDGTGLSPVLLTIEGYCNGVSPTQYWLQLHSVVPTTGVTVPLRSWQILAADGFTFNKNDIGLTLANLTNPPTQGALYLYLSSTDNVWTTPGITADLNVDIEEYELEIQGTTTVSSGGVVSSLTVVADGVNVTNKLISFSITETSGQMSYIQLFAAAPVVNTSIPLAGGQFSLSANGTVIERFGGVGRSFTSQDSIGTLHKGIYIGVSTTSGLYDGGANATISAVYK